MKHTDKLANSLPLTGDFPINAPAELLGQPIAAANLGTADSHPLRIALLGYRSSPYSGGQGIYLRYLSRALAARGHQVTVVSGPPYPDLDPGIVLERLPSLDLYAHGLRSVRPSTLLRDPLARVEWLSKLTGGFCEPATFGVRVRDWLSARRGAFDLVHDNQTLSDGVLALQHAGIPLVTTIHHPITRDRRLAIDAAERWYEKALVARWHSFVTMQGRVARELDNIVTVSGAARRDIVADFGVDPARVTVMHNGVDTDLFRPMPGTPRHPCQLMATASADTPHKGLQVLLRAAARLQNDYPELRLVLVGKPRPGGQTESLIRELGLEARATWVSNVSHERIVELYAESTVAVVPSLYEGFGLPAVEAMACGIPVVSSDGGALPEVVGDAGVLVPAGDDAALAGALQNLLADEALRRTLGEDARLRVEQAFSWDVCASRLVDYYRNVLARC